LGTSQIHQSIEQAGEVHKKPAILNTPHWNKSWISGIFKINQHMIIHKVDYY